MGRKSKYSIEEKLQAISDYKTGKRGITEICRDFGMSETTADSGTTVRRWIRKYEKYGEIALLPKRKNQSYTKEFKEKVIKEYL